MSPATIRAIVAIVLIGHGVGHGLGVAAAAGVKLSSTHSPDSWLFSSLIGSGAARGLGVVMWLVSAVAFVAAGLALAGWGVAPARWPMLGTMAAALSLVTIVCYWNGLPFLFPNKIGAISVDLAVLVAVVWLQWPARLMTS